MERTLPFLDCNPSLFCSVVKTTANNFVGPTADSACNGDSRLCLRILDALYSDLDFKEGKYGENYGGVTRSGGKRFSLRGCFFGLQSGVDACERQVRFLVGTPGSQM